MDIPWYAYLGGIAVIAWAAMLIIGTVGWARKKSGDSGVEAALTRNAQVNSAVLAKLDSIDSRLTAVEKTLTDIPS
ncbi:MAG: hypothetical protein JWO10_777 [Microbacteriaceae bacterium]|nr:hypothetical protein [Microbacteriaceae bacterium]